MYVDRTPPSAERRAIVTRSLVVRWYRLLILAHHLDRRDVLDPPRPCRRILGVALTGIGSEVAVRVVVEAIRWKHGDSRSVLPVWRSRTIEGECEDHSPLQREPGTVWVDVPV